MKLWKSGFIKDVSVTLTNLIVGVVVFPLVALYSAIALAFAQLKLDYTNNLYDPRDGDES